MFATALAVRSRQRRPPWQYLLDHRLAAAQRCYQHTVARRDTYRRLLTGLTRGRRPRRGSRNTAQWARDSSRTAGGVGARSGGGVGRTRLAQPAAQRAEIRSGRGRHLKEAGGYAGDDAFERYRRASRRGRDGRTLRKLGGRRGIGRGANRNLQGNGRDPADEISLRVQRIAGRAPASRLCAVRHRVISHMPPAACSTAPRPPRVPLSLHDEAAGASSHPANRRARPSSRRPCPRRGAHIPATRRLRARACRRAAARSTFPPPPHTRGCGRPEAENTATRYDAVRAPRHPTADHRHMRPASYIPHHAPPLEYSSR